MTRATRVQADAAPKEVSEVSSTTLTQDEDGMLIHVARAIYDAVSPHLLTFDELTPLQRRVFLDRARAAVRGSDITAIRAGLERAAQALAKHDHRTLAECEPKQRSHYRNLAQDAVGAYARHLTDASHDFDVAVLALQETERQQRVDTAHGRALREDEQETVLKQAREDCARLGGMA